ncbi:MAG: recombination regulator RecX [Treponema sp.]|jgi:regulatory protein|nr:recombination regulator RecX [Treponema sp.]
MKNISLKSIDDLYEVELSDGSLLLLRSCYLPQEIVSPLFNLDANRLSPIIEEGLHFAADCLLAEKAALRLIARAEQCSAGISLKLEKRKFSSKCADTVISRLIELKLIDDKRFARLWLESRPGLTRSPRRLLAGLVKRGIDMNCAKSILSEVLDEETEFSLLRRFAEKHSQEHDKQELEYLFKREGFSSKAIRLYFESF